MDGKLVIGRRHSSAKNKPHRAPLVIDKSLDSHSSLSDLDFAMRPAPSMVECLELPISLSEEHRKNPAVPFSGSPFPLNSPVDCNSIDCHSMAPAKYST